MRERQRDRDREMERDRDAERNSHRDAERQRDGERQGDGERDGERNRQRDREIERETERRRERAVLTEGERLGCGAVILFSSGQSGRLSCFRGRGREDGWKVKGWLERAFCLSCHTKPDDKAQSIHTEETGHYKSVCVCVCVCSV